ncbi:LysR family transcriptional regulator [Roseovarius faecimaris]|uniref:LysR family transcriptional regulator n=1 Tax=Roseovarius faecimaris TaxID=2494550 RepID=A0A6I6J0M9_9RHOB|nr:LysR family transcriptional regulator [Roseovarius faecimaris]QGX98388.1 LysR family transcriptional regulator [Roseovarius faecimaris]
MRKSQLSLKWLEVFQQVARHGSVQAAAAETGLSLSTASHHLKTLESALGTPLFDHSRRPMRVTATGAVVLRYVDEAMQLLHRAEAEAMAADMTQMRRLSLAMIEDFDSEVAPDLARVLSQSMPACAFRHLTRPSHEILALVRSGDVDIGIAARPQFDAEDLAETPLLRDPFVLALPATEAFSAETCLAGQTGLPLLRYSRDQIIGQRIEAQLRRLRVTLPNAYEFESNQTMMSMVAAGAGWAITTPTNYARAARFQRQVTLLPFPAKGFARTMSVFTREAHPSGALETVDSTLRQLIQTRVIDPTVTRMPWLRAGFTLLPAREPPSV